MKTKEEIAAYRKKWKQDHRERVNAQARKRYTTDGRWEKQLKDRFNLSSEQYWSMYTKQNGLCAICKRPQVVGTKLDVDHDHATGKIRGLLCRHCNTGLGLFKDSRLLILNALKYLLTIVPNFSTITNGGSQNENEDG